MYAAFFRRLEKSTLILEKKNALTAVIYELNISFKMQFFRVSKENTKIFPCGRFLFRVVDECLSKCPNSKKTPLPSNIPNYVPALMRDVNHFSLITGSMQQWSVKIVYNG